MNHISTSTAVRGLNVKSNSNNKVKKNCLSLYFEPPSIELTLGFIYINYYYWNNIISDNHNKIFYSHRWVWSSFAG